MDTQNEDHNIILQNRNRNRYKFINNLYKASTIFLYILLLELVIYLFVKITFFIFNKIRRIKIQMNLLEN